MKVGNIQRFSLNDGPGIRTTVFLKGCTIHCPWCANPENISYQSHWMFDKDKCVCNKDRCVIDSECPILQGKDILGKVAENGDFENCSAEAFYLQGWDMELENIEKAIIKDLPYYKNEGGVTFSGGEPLSLIEGYEELLVNIKKRGINIAVETSFFVNNSQLEIALKYVDLFIVDVKIIQERLCAEILGGNVKTYMENMERIFTEKKIVWFRMPVVKPYTYNKENIILVLNLLKKYTPNKMEIFKVHRLAKKKYEMLNKPMLEFEDVTDLEIEKLKKDIANIGINVEIINV